VAITLFTLFAHAADPRAEFFDGIKRNAPREVRTALLKGMDPNTVHPELGPAIVAAAAQQSYEAVRALLESPETSVDASNARGETALMFAALHGEIDVMKLLMRKGAQVNRTEWTPLHYAASGGKPEVVRFLLESHAYIDAQSPNHTTPLMMACRHKHVSVARLLIEEGADPTPRNDSGLAAADYLARNGEGELAAWMRERAREFEARYGTTTAPKTTENR
jgi:ankyrin repeat protein